ncbi:MAG: 50S ribosomal protein L29 [Candidatus Nealsonbacteria bacterium]|nr:50S ribosomal protein L29 [Candidatus Nealsonbacteria bacterium]
MKAQELKQKSPEELKKLLQDNREGLRQLKFDLASGKVKNIREIRQIRRDVARILTIQNKH